MVIYGNQGLAYFSDVLQGDAEKFSALPTLDPPHPPKLGNRSDFRKCVWPRTFQPLPLNIELTAA